MEMHSQKFKVRLGLFVSLGILLFIIAVFIIGKQKNLFNPVFKLTSTFYNVSGLKIGNNIRFSGVNVGTVDNIRIINDSTVRVDMLVRHEIKKFIKSDSKVAIGSEGLIGDKLLIITQGSSNSPLVVKNQQLKSIEPVEMESIIASVKATAENTEIITEQLALVMIKVNSGKGTLGRLIHDSDIAQDIKRTVGNFESSSQKLDETMKFTKDNLSDIMESFKVTADNIQVTSQQLEEIMVGINNGNGTVGKLLSDTVTSGSIDQTILNLQLSSKSLDENLEALKHNIFFRGYFSKKAKEDALKKMQ
jgi:phospholipid/cholesterol/gamma-HCH transport system substrate-binding protein